MVAAAVFSCGFVLLSKKVHVLWRQARTGDEILRVKVLQDNLPATTVKTKEIAPTQIASPIAPKVPDSVPNNISQGEQFPSILKPVPSIPISSPQTIAEPEKKAPEPPQFPSLLSLQPKDDRLNQEGMLYNSIQEALIQTEISMLPLIQWPLSEKQLYERTGFRDNSTLISAINARIELLNDSFQFQERLKELQNQAHIKVVFIDDLNDAWRESALRFALMSDQEFLSVKFQQLAGSTYHQISMIIERLKSYKAASAKLPDALNELNFQDLTLLQLRALRGKSLNQFLDKFSGPLIRLLNLDQIRSLDFANPEIFIKKESFDGLIGKGTNDTFFRRAARLLSQDQIMACLNRDFFDLETVRYLTPLQTNQIERSQLDPTKPVEAYLLKR